MRPILLLADDSVAIQRVVELTFADEDIEIVTASDGDEAIRLINGRPPDIVLVDVGMPGRNGYDVARYVKRSPLLSHIPVVLLVGAFEAIDQRRAEEAGCDGVLAKPFEPKLVVGKVRELLAHSPHGPMTRPIIRQVGAPSPTPRPSELAGQPADRTHAGSESASQIDEYFDRLDQAFSQLSSAPSGRSRAEVDQRSSGGGPETLTHEPGHAPAIQAARDAWDVVSGRGREPSASASDAAVPVAPMLPSLPEAFAALLSAERTAGRPQFAAQWPARPDAAGAIAPSEELIDQAARRVVEQIATQGVREAIIDVVSAVAERLVREEIARIKASVA